MVPGRFPAPVAKHLGEAPMPALSFSAERFGLSFLFRPMIEIRFEIRHLEFLWGGVSASRMLQYWAGDFAPTGHDVRLEQLGQLQLIC